MGNAWREFWATVLVAIIAVRDSITTVGVGARIARTSAENYEEVLRIEASATHAQAIADMEATVASLKPKK